MADRRLDPKVKAVLLGAQRNEITEYHIYQKLAAAVRLPPNREVLRRIADEELSHYNFWKTYTGRDVGPSRVKIWLYYTIARIFGITFGVKLMERGEENAQSIYRQVSSTVPDAQKILADEQKHEKQIISLINEELLKYVSSIILGLNDALVELTGALAGFTFALQNPKIISTAGFITGVAASFSMAASEYLSTKAEGGEKPPLTAAIYTGIAYLGVVLILIAPFLTLTNVYLALAATLVFGLGIILVFTFYISVAQDVSFSKRFSEMAGLSLGVAVVTFIIGLIARTVLGVEV